MSMHTKPRTMFTKSCRECEDLFKSSSKTSQYCATCRPIVRSRKMVATRALKKEQMMRDKLANPDKHTGGIDKKWLVRGTPSYDGCSDSISNGSF